MNMTSKLGPYINKLMTTVIDNKEDDFVKELALTELSRLNIDINEFIVKNSQNRKESEQNKKSEKQLLQEDK